MKHSAIILAGGKSSRMDHINKAFLHVNGIPMIQRVLSNVKRFDDVIIVANEPEKYKAFGVRVVTDVFPGKGPLSGIHAGLIHAEHRYCYVTACDTPFVPQEYIRYCVELEKKYDIAVPHWDGYFEPLCGMYAKTAVPEIVKAIDAGVKKPIEVFPYLNVHTIEKDVLKRFGDMDRIFTNINTRADLKRVNETEEDHEG